MHGDPQHAIAKDSAALTGSVGGLLTRWVGGRDLGVFGEE